MVSKVTYWNVANFSYDPKPFSYAVVILNKSLEVDIASHAFKIWNKGLIRICVDGGANALYNLARISYPITNGQSIDVATENEENYGLKQEPELPNIICGDFDSIEPSILEYFKFKGVQIIPTPDQNETDFTKALFVLKNYLKKCKIEIDHVIVIGGINSERFDHLMAYLNTLFKMREHMNIPMMMMTSHSLMWVLSPGVNVIEVPLSIIENESTSWCGYSTLAKSAFVTTTGLKWDLDNKEVEFGKLISTSNTYEPNSDGKVTIKCSNPLLWFMGWSP